MKKSSISRKLIMSIATASMTAVCFGATTYAWFSRNDVVWTEETDFNLDFYKGLLISFDGVNYHQDVTKEELYQAITGETDAAAATEKFQAIAFDGVTPTADADGKVTFTDGRVDFNYDTVNEETNLHTPAAAKANEKYIAIDLYFRIADGGTVTEGKDAPDYNLVFTDKTHVNSKSGVQKVPLVNSLTTMDKTYVAGEEINVDGANALRVGIQNDTAFTVYEPVNEYNLGSAAIETSKGKAEDPLHDPEKNAMYTYYNNFFSAKFLNAASDCEAFTTHATFADGSVLGTFKGTTTTDANGNAIYGYNDIKLTLYVWLEGWDADYFYGITSSNTLARTMQSYFEFTYQEA